MKLINLGESYELKPEFGDAVKIVTDICGLEIRMGTIGVHSPGERHCAERARPERGQQYAGA